MISVVKLDFKVGHFVSFFMEKLSEFFTEFDKIFRNWNLFDLRSFKWGSKLEFLFFGFSEEFYS